MPTAACYTSKWLPAVVSIAGRRAHVQRTMTVERRHWRGGHLRGATAGSLQTDLLQSVWRTRAKRSAGLPLPWLGGGFLCPRTLAKHTCDSLRVRLVVLKCG